MYFWLMNRLFLFLMCFAGSIMTIWGQSVDVRYDKNRDLSVYKTFEMGESGVITPKDKRKYDEKTLKAMVTKRLVAELQSKGLEQLDSNAQLVVTFIVGAVDRTEVQFNGPLGGTPGYNYQYGTGYAPYRTEVLDVKEGSLGIALYDKSNNLIWRVNGAGKADMAQTEILIERIVHKGFNKFSLKPAKKKKKK